MTESIPTDIDQPWWKGAPESAIRGITEAGAGIIVWHHALIAFPGWEFWDDVCGHMNRTLKPHFEQKVLHRVTEPGHPVMSSIATDFTLDDETYEMDEPLSEGNEVLMKTQHPHSLKSQVWARLHENSRVVCIIPGHDARAWNATPFKQLFAQSIQWVAQVTK